MFTNTVQPLIIASRYDILNYLNLHKFLLLLLVDKTVNVYHHYNLMDVFDRSCRFLLYNVVITLFSSMSQCNTSTKGSCCKLKERTRILPKIS